MTNLPLRMLTLLSSLACLCGVTPIHAQLQSPTLPEGFQETVDYVDVPNGKQVRNGKYILESAEGQRLVSGGYKQGVRNGLWLYRDHSDQLRSRGKYSKGQRAGKWQFYWAGDVLMAEGNYRMGHPQGEWSFFDPDGRTINNLSGQYDLVERMAQADQVVGWGPTLNGLQHGRWWYVWPEGSLRAWAHYTHGQRTGEWFYWHRNGSFDDKFLSGKYSTPEIDGILHAEPLRWDFWQEARELWRGRIARSKEPTTRQRPQSIVRTPSEITELQERLESDPLIIPHEEVKHRWPELSLDSEEARTAEKLIDAVLDATDLQSLSKVRESFIERRSPFPSGRPRPRQT